MNVGVQTNPEVKAANSLHLYLLRSYDLLQWNSLALKFKRKMVRFQIWVKKRPEHEILS